MKRLISAVLLSAAVVVPTMAKNAKTLGLVGTLLQLVSLAVSKQTGIIRHFMSLELEIVIIAKEVVVTSAGY